MEFKKINGFNHRYSVSNTGVIRNDERNTILKPMLSTSGYYYVHLVVERKKYTQYVHRLVGQCFISNPNNYEQIDHINGNKLDNNVSNLRWVSVSTNRMAYGSKQRAKNRMRKVKAVHCDGTELCFNSRKDASTHFGCSPSKIRYGYLYKKGNKKDWIFELV